MIKLKIISIFIITSWIADVIDSGDPGHAIEVTECPIFHDQLVKWHVECFDPFLLRFFELSLGRFRLQSGNVFVELVAVILAKEIFSCLNIS